MKKSGDHGMKEMNKQKVRRNKMEKWKKENREMEIELVTFFIEAFSTSFLTNIFRGSESENCRKLMNE